MEERHSNGRQEHLLRVVPAANLFRGDERKYIKRTQVQNRINFKIRPISRKSSRGIAEGKCCGLCRDAACAQGSVPSYQHDPIAAAIYATVGWNSCLIIRQERLALSVGIVGILASCSASQSFAGVYQEAH